MLDLAIAGGTVTTLGRSSVVDLGVVDGKIACVSARDALPPARATVDARGLLVLPGVIDAHFHCFDPGHPEREDFDSGTRAAAAGGVTTIFEMPIATPGVHNADVLRDRRALAEKRAHVDFGLWGGGGSGSERDIREMVTEGAVGFKIFLYEAAPGREAEFKGLSAVGSPALLRAFRAIEPTGLPVAVHCEDHDLIQALTAELRAAGDIFGNAHGRSRPPWVEAVAISKVVQLAGATGVRIHFPHIGSELALRTIVAAREQGSDATLETCPHYLFSDDSALESLGPYAKINPPVRGASDQRALWQGLERGDVDIVASDHSPYGPAEKEPGWKDIFSASPGSPGVETMGPLMWDAALGGRIPMTRAVELLSERPAKIFGLGGRKGSLEVGADADLVLVDPAGSWTIELAGLLTRSRDSARLFAGRSLRGRLRRTYVRGRPVFEDGRILGKPGEGRFVRPSI